MDVQGINMKKLLILFFLCTTVSAVLLLLCAFNQWWILAAIIITGLCGMILSLLGLLRYKKFIEPILIDPKQNLKRNYKFLVLGKLNSDRENNGQILDMRGYSRNLYVDFLMLQRYYSFLDSTGTILWEIDLSDIAYIEKHHISILDYLLLHEVTLIEHGIQMRSVKIKIRILLIGLVYFYYVLKNKIYIKSNKKYELNKNSIINEAYTFCNDRNLNIQIKFK